MKYFTGIGSRKTPNDVLALMSSLSQSLCANNYCLRSGGADGADQAFAKNIHSANKEIYIPWQNFNGLNSKQEGVYCLQNFPIELKTQTWEIVKEVHPNWRSLSQGAAKLHARNAFQVLGQDLKTPSQIVICWTPEGKEVGGTRTAIKIAQKYGVPVWNLGTP